MHFRFRSSLLDILSFSASRPRLRSTRCSDSRPPCTQSWRSGESPSRCDQIGPVLLRDHGHQASAKPFRTGGCLVAFSQPTSGLAFLQLMPSEASRNTLKENVFNENELIQCNAKKVIDFERRGKVACSSLGSSSLFKDL